MSYSLRPDHSESYFLSRSRGRDVFMHAWMPMKTSRCRQFYTYLRAINATATITEDDVLGTAMAVERSELKASACGIEIQNWKLDLKGRSFFLAPKTRPSGLATSGNAKRVWEARMQSPVSRSLQRNAVPASDPRPHEQWLQSKAGQPSRAGAGLERRRQCKDASSCDCCTDDVIPASAMCRSFCASASTSTSIQFTLR